MAKLVITMKIMPDSPERNLDEIQKKAIDVITKYDGRIYKAWKEPVAFGINVIKVSFIADEEKGGTEEIEKEIKNIEGVSEAETADVTRMVDF